MLNFIKQFIIYGLSSTLSKIAAVFLLPLYTNVLSQEEYGALAIITAAKGIIDLFSNLNIHSGVARDYYESDVDRTKIVSTGFFSIILFSIITALMLYSGKYWVTNVLEINNYENVFTFMILTIPTGSLVSYFSILTRYKQKAAAYSIGSLLQLSVQIGITIYCIIVNNTGIIGIFYGLLIGEMIGITYFYFLNREFIKLTFDFELLKRILKYSLPTLPAIAAIWADSNLGQLFIGRYISLSDAGIYSIALRIASVYMLIQQSFGNIWLPFVYENLDKPNFEKKTIWIYNAATVSLVFISINLSIFSEQIILLLSTPKYIDSSKILILLTIPMSISILIQLANIGPNISRNTKLISFSNIIGSTVNLICLFLFLPFYGVNTVPISLLLSRLIIFFLTIYYTKKEIEIKFPIKNAFLIIIPTLILYLFVDHFGNIKPLIFFIFNILALSLLISNSKINILFKKIYNSIVPNKINQ